MAKQYRRRLPRFIVASLRYTGTTHEQLARLLGISDNALRRRMNNPGDFRESELRTMKDYFKWDSYDMDCCSTGIHM